MDDFDWGEYWWSSVTGPREVVSSTIRALRSKKSVVLWVPYDLPWRHELRNTVRCGLEALPDLEELIVDTVDIGDESANETEPGRLLLDKYALRDDKNKFREGGNESIQDYLLRKNVISNRLVWIKGIASDCSQKWIDFCECWSPSEHTDGLLVIEVREEPQTARSSRVELVKYEDCVSEYDAQLFNSLVVEKGSLNSLSARWKRYAAAVATHLCGTDVEIAYNFIGQHDFKLADPIETVSLIDNSGLFEQRGGESHVLALYRNDDIAELVKRVWAAQIEALFPLIERQRLEVIDDYRSQFEVAIASNIMQFDKKNREV